MLSRFAVYKLSLEVYNLAIHIDTTVYDCVFCYNIMRPMCGRCVKYAMSRIVGPLFGL